MQQNRAQPRRRGRQGMSLIPLSRPVVAACGRAAVVWLGVAMIAAAEHPLDAGGLVAVSGAAAVWLISLRVASASAPYALGPWVPAAMGTATGLVCVAAVNPYVAGLEVSLASLCGMAVGVFLSTGTWETILERTARRRVLVIGTDAVAEIADAARRERRVPFDILGTSGLPSTWPGMAPSSLGDLEELAEVVDAQQPDVIVLADGQSCSAALERLLDMTDRRFRVAGLTSFYEYAFGWLPLEHLTPMWFLSLLHVRQRPGRRPSKRIFDVVLAATGLVLTVLLLPLLVLLVKQTPGPLVYRQTRVGERGRRFTMYKFRTMPAGAERPGEPVFAQAHDPRASAAGRFLRRTHLDELPQLWNVLKGDMSIVGPRPERPEFVEMLESAVPFWSRRLLMKPGMTGWAQVRCGYASDCASAAEKLSYDFWYMRHGSLAVDLAVCIETVLQRLELFDPRRLRLRRRRPAGGDPDASYCDAASR
jgi:exopolysaccharide biosynthesis polyprenyl glycosylphosphotransferase